MSQSSAEPAQRRAVTTATLAGETAAPSVTTSVPSVATDATLARVSAARETAISLSLKELATATAASGEEVSAGGVPPLTYPPSPIEMPSATNGGATANPAQNATP